MKTFTTIFITLVFVLSMSAGAQTVFKLDSIHQFAWDQVTMQWDHNTRELYTYGNGGNKETNLLRLVLNGGDWENFYQFNKTYNSNNDIEERIRQNWDGSNWQNSEQLTYTYNADDLVEKLAYAIYTNPVWLVFNENTYQYDMLGNRTQDLLTEYDFVSMLLRNKERRTYDFTSSILNYEILEQWRDILNDWENEERKDYFYDTDGTLIREEVSGWNIGAGMWANPFRQFLYSYNADDLVEEIIDQLYVTDTWVNNNRTLFTYTSNNLTEFLGQEWSNSMMQWENDFRQLRTFDGDDNEIELIFETWDDMDGAWEGTLRILKFWSIAETLSVNFEDAIETSIYPNPFIDRLNIKLKHPSSRVLKVNLYTVSGQLIKQKLVQPNTSEFSFELTNESAGSYVMHMYSGNEKAVFKILKN
ncbi:T9SS type A sorting domain-containing protein [Winogradskyella sp. 3972H.M.0a.05]|uniref:T9SS type A sorting domain-containing protein n=1 Tax=Winogradskyella sp. 3972H.M.0a.05 TaxID=2950277 RepID=UPI0033930A3C